MEVVYQLRRWDWRIGRKNAPSCVILDALKLVQVVLRGAQQDGVSIIKTRLYEGSCKRDADIHWEGGAAMTNRSDVEERRLAHGRHVRVQREALVQCEAERNNALR